MQPNQTQLMKWLFLLRRESPLKEGSTFYDFLPYRYGPFSFEVYKELGELTREGYLKHSELCIPDDRIADAWKIETALPHGARRSVVALLEQYGSLSASKLRQIVYKRYPWYASRSELASPPQKVPPAPLAIYTIGYQGKSIDRFLDELLGKGIRTLIDTRSYPMSRKYGFSKNSLQILASKVGIRYLHFPELGIDGYLRRQERYANVQGLLDFYEQEILPRRQKPCEQVSKRMRSEASALMCFEADVEYCHRGRLASKIARLAHLEIIHL